MNRILGVLGFLLQLVALHHFIFAAELPVETFFRDPEFGEAEISPDGKFLALIAPSKGRRNLLAINLENLEMNWLTGFSDRNVYEITWVGNERIVLKMERDGLESGGFYAVNRDGSRKAILIPTPADFKGSEVYNAEILHIWPDDPEHVLVAAIDPKFYSGWNDFLFPDVESLNVFTGTAKPVVKNPGNVLSWVADSRGVVRAGVELNGDKLRLRYRKDARSSWKTIAESPLADFDCWPLKFTPDDQDLFVYASNGRNTTGLYIFEVARRALGECLWQHAEFDIGSIGLTRNGKPACISYTADRLQSHWLVPEWVAIQAGIDKALPGTVNRVASVSKDGSKVVFRSSGDRTPGAYYLYEKDTRQLHKLRDIMGWINPEEMAPMRPISYVARDGLTIPGYLTLPLGSPGTNLPTVIMPHGGPWTRDRWGFDSEVQFLANRGYAVLQMNFRGSTGYGFAFMKAGFKQWGLKMQDDITDGVKWAIAQGITDKTRVGIFGASYGGYAAMMGLTQTPELYKCGINYAGVTDITLLLKVDAYRLPKLTGFQRLALGDAKGDRDKLEATSPINHVDKIRAPVLLIYGGQDQRVRVTQGKRLASELKKHGKQYEMILEEAEGHGFHIEKNKIEMYKKLDAFLKKNL